MRAFIVRPFGTRDGIDFDRVETSLIRPGLAAHGVEGATTQVFAQAGNIRADMFEQLMVADLVVADISIHNANVYYELGLRHALRDRHTILIRCAQDEVPFDLRTDRYVVYPKDDPAQALPLFDEAVRQTLAATKADSPVFLMLPELKAQDPEVLLPAPALFVEAVQRAQAICDRASLCLMGEEISTLQWALQGWRVIGRAQFAIKHFAGARETWNQVRSRLPDDVEANLLLATISQRLGDQPGSNAAIERALAATSLSKHQRAEARALLGSNLKAQWAAEWRAAPSAERAATALRSGYLYQSYEAYRRGFAEDQNHFYSGLNALALSSVIVGLAGIVPAAWKSRYESDPDASRELKGLRELSACLAYCVKQSMDAAAERDAREGRFDIWREISEADLALLTSKRPEHVARKYGDARRRLSAKPGANQAFPADAAARQIRLYLELGLFTGNARAAIQELGVPDREASVEPARRTRVILFAGHRVDAPGRSTPRFPASRVEAVRQAIARLVAHEREEAAGPVIGMAGGASGGDLLFHEVCAEAGSPSTVMLAVPPEQYLVESVKDSGPEWVERFWQLCRASVPVVFGESRDVPAWLSSIRGYTIWQRNNLWMLATALARDDSDVSLVLLWDGKASGDGPGGTADMAALAGRRGVKVLPRIDPMTGS